MNKAENHSLEYFLEQLLVQSEHLDDQQGIRKIKQLQNEIRQFRIRVPLIGKFSAGKSTLLNTLMDVGDILDVDILPETSIPTEICYSNEDHVYLYPLAQGAGTTEISTKAYLNREYDPSALKKIRLALRLDALRHLPDIDLIDMPGFDSGIEEHNRILDSEAVIGNAHLLVFSIEEAMVKENMASILRELALREGNVPIGVVITKSLRKPEEDWGEIKDHLQADLHRYLQQDFPIYLTDRDMPESMENIHDFLLRLQAQRPSLLAACYLPRAAALANELRMLLKKRNFDLDLSQSDFGAQEAALEQKLAKLEQLVEEQRQAFQRELPLCKDKILHDVSDKLYSRENSYIQSLLKGRSPEEEINSDVRETVVQGIKGYFEPKVQAYVAQIQTGICSLILPPSEHPAGNDSQLLGLGAGTGFAVGGTAALLGGGSAVATALSSTTAIGAGIVSTLSASMITVMLPVVGLLLGGIVAALLQGFSKAKREELKKKYQQTLREDVFPKILNELGCKLEVELTTAAEKLDASVREEVGEKIQLLKHNLDEIREKHRQSDEELSQAREQASRELSEWEDLCHEYGC